uniref:DUF4855 domain-containing protein n=1 Tax=uncultured Draconibacterium sp. TaxID=1573823 RepID=UPI00321629FD
MKIHFVNRLIVFVLLICTALSCNNASDGKSPYYGKTNIADMVLIYHGAVHRPLEWNKDQFIPYVVHQDRQGKKNWLFDGFLFTEYVDGKGHHFAHGNATTTLARQPEWKWLMDRQFEKDRGLSGLDQCIGEQIKEMGNPPFRHKVVVVMPVPEKEQTDWGKINRPLNFTNDEDRIEACKWYVDSFLERYRQQGYKNFDLEGFYWVCEKDGTYRDILVPIGDYIRSKNLRFFWIPYWTALGFDNWKTDKFDLAYIQPNYFLKDEIPRERLDAVCAFAKGTNMGVEMEFDSRALADSPENKRDRLISYIEAFEENGVFKEASIAYYEGGGAIYDFYRSDNPLDKEIMDRLANIIIRRKKIEFRNK